MSTGSNDKPLILLVDDSRVMRIALKKILQPEFDVIEASNGEAGWEALQEHPAVRCVFTDLAMPELDGFGLLGRIRAAGEARISGVPVIIITGNEDDPSMRSRAVEQGANDVVMKPFQTADILATTKKHLTAPRPAAPAPKPA
ncbi:MAG: response regulator, partial [Chromatiales bacterium]|nr:response regulator [Chromatiales bacterium]